MDRAYLEAERELHREDLGECWYCMEPWPCDQSQIVDLALAAEGYRKALVVAQDFADAQRAWQSNQIQLWEYVTQRRDALLAAFPEGHQTLGAALGGTQ